MRLLLALALLVYPLALYLLLDQLQPAALAALFALLAGGRLLLAKHVSTAATVAGITALVLLCVLTAFADSITLLKLYPVALSAGAALWFGYTLASPPSAIHRAINALNRSSSGLPQQVRERIPLANSVDPDQALAPSPAQLTYMRGLTAVWLAFFVFNALVSAYTALGTGTGLWSLYNGVISYSIVGLLVACEVMYRGVYQRRQQNLSRP